MEFFMTIVLCSICTTRPKVHQHHSQAQKGLLDVMNRLQWYRATRTVLAQEPRPALNGKQRYMSFVDEHLPVKAMRVPLTIPACLCSIDQARIESLCQSILALQFFFFFFCADEHRDGWLWDGNLVSIVNENGKAHGLIVPQSEVLASLEEASGKTWCLSG